MGKKFIDKKHAVSYKLVPVETGPAQFESNAAKHTFVQISNQNKGSVNCPLQLESSNELEPIKVNREYPSKGPRPDWDPDVIAGLDDDFDFKDPENFLSDDFVIKANELSCHLEISDFSVDNHGGDYDECRSEYSDFSDYSDSEDSVRNERKSRFTSYSMSSAVSNCSENIKVLNERFEKLLELYEDDQLGALDSENSEQIEVADYEKVPEFLDSHTQASNNINVLVYECEEETKEKILQYINDERAEILDTIIEERIDDFCACSSGESSAVEFSKPVIISVRDKIKRTANAGKQNSTKVSKEQFDYCIKQKKDVSSFVSECRARSKNETAEERRERKQMVKAARKESRRLKKECKTAFRKERMRQTIQEANTHKLVGIKM